MRKIVDELYKQNNVRSNLSELRKHIKDPEKLRELQKILKQDPDGKGRELLLSFLKSQDAKTRKNAALLIGDLKWQECKRALYEAYQTDTTRFVKSSYLQALKQLRIPELVPELKKSLKGLQSLELTEENRKHVEEEMRELQQIIIQYEGITHHKFSPVGKTLEVLLLTNRNLRENICNRISAGEAKVHPLGVLVKTDRFSAISKIRTYRELVFPVHAGGMLSPEPRKAAQEIWKGDLYTLLTGMHEAGEETFYYRLDCRSSMDLEKRSDFAKQFTTALDQISGGKLMNSPSDYEVEIRLIASKDGRFFPCIRLYTYTDTRFSYRKNSIAASMAPSTAALIVELAKPYLKEDGQIMDPFCGVGTLLIERNRLVPAKDMYGTDTFRDAIVLGRENAQAAKTRINFIQRDFFDFHHEYLFDEIITDMPMRGKKTREEMDQLYAAFFGKLPEILAPSAVIIMYTNETAFVKKQLRLHKEYRILQETNMQKSTEGKQGFDLLILQRQ